ncbi:hypothetical protein EGW07_25605 [Citrobacter amalonaticus]|nr:hypothetical protein EGW07_25605 [Citrobacter amalonaticus]
MSYKNAADMRATARDSWHSEWISKSGLKERLWTDKAIAEFSIYTVSNPPVTQSSNPKTTRTSP